jgi:hypothetical protein
MLIPLAFLIIKMNIICSSILGMNGAHLIIGYDVWNKKKSNVLTSLNVTKRQVFKQNKFTYNFYDLKFISNGTNSPWKRKNQLQNHFVPFVLFQRV